MQGVSEAPPDHRPRDDRPSAGQNGYRFHMQQREPASGRSTRPDTGRIDTRKGTEHVFQRNLRLFFFVSIGMALFFFVTLTIYRKSSQRKQARVVSGISAAQATAPRSSRSRVARADARESEWLSGTGVTMEPDPETLQRAVMLARQADSLRDAGRYPEACQQYSEALKVWPYLSKARAELGRLHLKLKNYAQARIDLEHAVDDDPASPGLLNDFGVALFHVRRFDRAMKLFETAAQTSPDLAEAHFNLALCYTAQGERAKAKDALDKYLKLKPDDPPALKQLAFLAAADGHYTNAMEILTTAMTKAPDWPPAYFDAAATAALMGRPQDAISYLTKAEALASPVAVYMVYQQPAFRETRNTDRGKAYGVEIEEKARKQSGTVDVGALLNNMPEPLMSPPEP